MEDTHPIHFAHHDPLMGVRASGEATATPLPDAVKYPDLAPAYCGEATATDALRTWIREAFQRSKPASWFTAILAAGQDVRPRPSPISPDSKVWSDLRASPALWVWMSILSREQGIAPSFGRTEEPFDDGYWKLHDLALEFANHLFLLSEDGFDDAIFLSV